MAAKRSGSELGVELAWVFDIVRWKLGERDTEARPISQSRSRIANKRNGVVALGLGGVEAGNPPEPFEPWFDRARAAGLRSVPHAGEFGGPESIRGAIEQLGAEQIGHGVRAIEDPALVANWLSGGFRWRSRRRATPAWELTRRSTEHPFRALQEAA